MEFKKVEKLKFVLSLGGSLLLSSADLLGIHVVELVETPLGTYEERALPPVKRLKKRQILDVPAAKDQGPLGTCTSFAVVGCGEYHYRRKLSEAEFTTLAETQLVSADCKPGLHLGLGLKVGQKYGFIDEERLPYNPYLRYVATKNKVPLYALDWQDQLRKKLNLDICRRDMTGRQYDPRASYNNTMREMGVDLALTGTAKDAGYRLGELYPIHHTSIKALSTALQTGNAVYEEGGIGGASNASIKKVRVALSNGFPVATALPIFDTFLNPTIVNDYTITAPNEGRSIGSHAVILFGYDTNKETFRVKNSWKSWGDEEGFANLSFDYVRDYATQLVAVAGR